MKNVCVAFRILPKGETAPGGYKKIPCHMIFDIKMTDFAWKAMLVAGGHLTGAPAAMTCASVVSRETICIALTIAALNSLDVKTGDVMNAYITAPVTEKVWTILGPEFGDADCGLHAQLFMHPSLHLCNAWGSPHVKLTLTCGIRLRPTPSTILIIMLISFATLTISSSCTMTPRPCLRKFTAICR